MVPMGVEDTSRTLRHALLNSGELILTNSTRPRRTYQHARYARSFRTTPVSKGRYERTEKDRYCQVSTITKKGRYIPDTYFLLLFLWFAAIFSFAVIGAGFELPTPATAPVAEFVSVLSGFFPLLFWLPLSLIRDHTVRKMIYIV